MNITKKLLLLILCTLFISKVTQSSPSSEKEIEEDTYEDDDLTNTLSVKVETKSSSENTENPTESKASPFSFPKKAKVEGNQNAQKSIWENLAHINWADYWIECILALALSSYYAVYLLGSGQNEKLAKKWLKGSIEYFTQQFSILGDDRGFFLMRNGASDFIFYATGRANCNFVFGRLQLYPRHDVFRMIYSLYQPVYDHVEIQVQLPESTFNGVFGVVPRNLSNGLRKERNDVNYFTKQSNDPSLPEGLVVLSEHGDITRAILTTQLISKLKEIKQGFEGFVISDQPRIQPESLPIQTNHTITFKYRFNNSEQLASLHRLLLHIVDSVSTIDFRSDLKAKLLKNREEAYSSLLKEERERQKEELEERLNQKRRKELESRESLSPAAQRKLEEKEAKKKTKKQQAKMTIRK
ncbi:DUF1682-domain-containing protein [Neoconidiobolus thromboides FSU 785]|nr:DUF1682-domain-containing protein [Neoconidiobolus thromboides FSU 785]